MLNAVVTRFAIFVETSSSIAYFPLLPPALPYLARSPVSTPSEDREPRCSLPAQARLLSIDAA